MNSAAILNRAPLQIKTITDSSTQIDSALTSGGGYWVQVEGPVHMRQGPAGDTATTDDSLLTPDSLRRVRAVSTNQLYLQFITPTTHNVKIRIYKG